MVVLLDELAAKNKKNRDELAALQEKTEISDEDYLRSIERREGVFMPEKFSTPYTNEFTKGAKNVVKQLYDLYKSGDQDVISAIHEYEKSTVSRKGYTNDIAGQKLYDESLSERLSKDTLHQRSMWDLFYSAYQHYIGSRLTDEDNGPMYNSPEYQELAKQYRFDAQGRPAFDFNALGDKLDVPGFGPLKPVGQEPWSFEKLFREGK